MQTIYNWYGKYPDFREKYNIAKQNSADFHAERIISISEDVLENKVNHNAGRLASDNYKWLASVHNPKVYGKQLTVNKGIDYQDAEIQDLERMLRESQQRVKRITDSVVEVIPPDIPETMQDWTSSNSSQYLQYKGNTRQPLQSLQYLQSLDQTHVSYSENQLAERLSQLFTAGPVETYHREFSDNEVDEKIPPSISPSRSDNLITFHLVLSI